MLEHEEVRIKQPTGLEGLVQERNGFEVVLCRVRGGVGKGEAERYGQIEMQRQTEIHTGRRIDTQTHRHIETDRHIDT
jgi:hypothetical protein